MLTRVLRWCALLPLPVLHTLGVGCGWLLTLIPNEQRRIAAINLDYCLPNLTRAQQKRLLRQTLCESGKALFELGPIWLWPGQRILRKVRSVSGEQAWHQARKQGAIIITPHLGAWEVAGLYTSRHCQMVTVYRPSRHSILDQLAKSAREREGAELVPATAAGVRKLYKALRDNAVVGILPDQDPARESGVFAPFFGKPALTMTLVSRLARARRRPVFIAIAQRLSWGRGYHLTYQPIPEILAAATLELSVSALNDAVAAAIREHPEQYLWSYKRFKTPPPNSKSIYKRR